MSWIFKGLNKLLSFFSLRLIRFNDDYFLKAILYSELFQINSKIIDNSLGCIIFSKDRALQLDGLLRSFYLNKIGECRIMVIYSSSSKEHKKAYIEVIDRHKKEVVFVEEFGGFKTTLVKVINFIETAKVFFLVDDIIFIEPVDFDYLSRIDTSKFIFSLRMGNHLSYSYVVSKDQGLPVFINKNDEYLYWDWTRAELDWAYPFSVDGHIFGLEEIKLLTEFSDFKAPNSFEGALQKEISLFSNRLSMSYRKARIFNNPCNKVQKEANNLHGNFHQDDLLKGWQNGDELDIDSLQGYLNKSVHEEVYLNFNKRS
jgi:hypothetical protein